MSWIKCCHGCVPPERTSDCHTYCPRYIKERAEYDKRMEEEKAKRSGFNSSYEQRSDMVNKANKRKRTYR